MQSVFRLRRHADFQRVYQKSRKQFSRQIAFFFALREESGLASDGPRVGLTVGKVMGKAVDRNRIKRRLRAAIQKSVGGIDAPVDIVLHPRRSVLDVEFAALEREIAEIFGKIRHTLAKSTLKDEVSQ